MPCLWCYLYYDSNRRSASKFSPASVAQETQRKKTKNQDIGYGQYLWPSHSFLCPSLVCPPQSPSPPPTHPTPKTSPESVSRGTFFLSELLEGGRGKEEGRPGNSGVKSPLAPLPTRRGTNHGRRKKLEEPIATNACSTGQ